MRVGEAAVPGPVEVPCWGLGSTNPTGIAGKASQYKDLPDGIYAVSESHLSARGRSRFARELHGQSSRFKFCGGYDAPLKRQSILSVGGKHTGVGFMSTYPTRSIACGWNDELYQSSRIHAAVFQVGDSWVGGGVVYGYSHSPETNETLRKTNDLLEEVSRQLVEPFHGPAFVAGDWNQPYGRLPEAMKWEKRGWRDIQTWSEEHLGIPAGTTCKYVSRKDFVYINPELQELMLTVHNEYDRFADHSTLYATLRFPSAPKPIPRWRKPKPIQYDKVTTAMIAAAEGPNVNRDNDPTKQY